MSEPLTNEDLPEIKAAIIKFRDDLKKHLDDLKKHLEDGERIGNFAGAAALEEVLREPRGLRPYEADSLYCADLPRDLVEALASLWQKCWRYGSLGERFDLQNAIDEVLRIIAEPDNPPQKYGPSDTIGILFWDHKPVKISKTNWKFLCAVWGTDRMPFSEVGAEVWGDNLKNDTTIRTRAGKVSSELYGKYEISLDFTCCDEHVSLIGDWPE